MDERRVADYFVVAGLPDSPLPLEEFSNEAIIKPTCKQDPITDICVINKSLGEKEPKGYVCLERTQSGLPADLNYGSIRCPEMFICYRRSREKPPLTDIGVLYEGKEKLMAGCEIVHTTPYGNPANVNNSNSSRIYITYRRASETASSDTLAVVDICIILTNKNESAPHAYCQINKNLNKAMVGSDIYLCYKKAMTKADVLAYEPAILGRFPPDDYENFPLPASVPLFCLPMGATIECWSAKAQHPLPVFSTFILTTSGGEKAYGAAVSFYEEFPEEKLTDLQLRHLGLKNKHIREQYRILKTVHSNKCICLLSRWPFFDAFKKFLSYLYRISITGPYTVPIERHISHFMYDVPYPSPQRPRILVQLNHEALCLSMPEDSPLPQSGASFITLLKNLGPENCMTILLHVLLEQKILIHSLRPAVLTGVAEAVTTLIFPLHWQCPYIPLCPLGLSGVLSAPCPFIVGIDSRYFDLYDPPADVVCVDLDTNTIWFDDKKAINSKLLPKKPARVLQDTLHKIFDQLCQQPSTTQTPDEVLLEMAPIDYDFKQKQNETMIELQIQEAFLRFMACLMKGYKTYLKPIMREPTANTTKAASLFDMQGFLKSRDKAYVKFFMLLLKTQTYIRFIEERSFVSDKDASLAFFDECTEKVDDTKDEPKLIDFDETHKSERTVFIMPPEPTGLPEGVKYSYNGFPELKPELFLMKKASTLSLPGKQSICPNSPMAKRTKQEVRMAQKIAQQQVGTPMLWAKCLLGHCYCLWFIHLPAFVKLSQSKARALRLAYDVLRKMNVMKDIRPDEVCYRVVLQLCGQYNEPTLAVKVLFEMKRAGVQPNAITYGYYNKAVLESKWPSATSKGLLLWNKLRNVITAVAQLRRRAAHQRSASYCSNSESDFDQVSHTSIDSCMEDVTASIIDTGGTNNTGLNTTTPKTELAIDMVVTGSNGNKGANEERMSTGGASDRGYSSMTQEDAKTLCGALASAEQNQADNAKTKKEAKSSRSDVRWKTKSKSTADELSAISNSSESPSTEGVNSHFRARVGSIVRRSARNISSVSSFESLKASLFGSSAGVLMVSESILKNHNLHQLDTLELDAKRKRHKSAGDNHLKTRSNSMFSNWTPPSAWNGSNVLMRFSDLVSKEKISDKGTDQKSPENVQITSSELNIEDSGVGLNDNNQTSAFVSLSSEVSELERVRVDCQETQLNSTQSTKNSLSQSSSFSTPVTENDPLGLFDNHPEVAEMNNNSSPNLVKPSNSISRRLSQLTKVEALSKKSPERTLFDIQALRTNNVCNTLHEECVDGEIVVGTRYDPGGNRKLGDLGRTSSSPDCLAESKFSQQTPQKKSKLSSTLSLDEAGNVERPQDIRLRRSHSLRRRNEMFSGVFKSAAIMFNKLNEIKQSITQQPGQTGSNLSLTPSEDRDSGTGDEDSYDGGLRGLKKKMSGSLDFLSRSDNHLDESLTEDGRRSSHDSVSSPTFTKQYIPMKELSDSSNKSTSAESYLSSGFDLLEKMGEVALEVEISSCCRCSNCHCLLYDEEIMAGWSADDSNLNTSCAFCAKTLVPHLQIYIKDLREKQNKSICPESTFATSPESSSISLPPDKESDENMEESTPDDIESSPVFQRKSSVKSTSSCDNPVSGEEMSNRDSLEQSHGDGEADDKKPPPQEVMSPSENATNHENSSETNKLNESETDEVVEGEVDLMMNSPLQTTRRRCTSECLTTATDSSAVYSSSVISADGHTCLKHLRSLSMEMCISENVEEPTNQLTLSPESKEDLSKSSVVEPIEVPYLSPLVLRKELENVIDREGDLCLVEASFVDEHPILFWNLIWYFKRIAVPCHLPGFLLKSKAVKQSQEEVDEQNKNKYSSKNVYIRTMWDNVKLHADMGIPMYISWNTGHTSTSTEDSQSYSRPLMHQIITSIQVVNDVLAPIRLLSNARPRKKGRKGHTRSLYREILFLSFVACGRNFIDLDAFDNEYKNAFNKLSSAEVKRLQPDDKPHSLAVQWCRAVFEDLEI